MLELVMLAVIGAEHPTPEAIVAKAKEQQKNAIKRAEAQLKTVSKGRVTRDKAKERADTVKALKEELAGLKDGSLMPIPIFFITEMNVGDFGQVMEEYNVRADATVFQIVSPTTMLLKHGDLNFFVEGLGTAKLTDNDKVDLGMLYVAGTKTYQNIVGGTKTVYVLKPLDLTAAKKLWEEQRPKKGAAKKPAKKDD